MAPKADQEGLLVTKTVEELEKAEQLAQAALAEQTQDAHASADDVLQHFMDALKLAAADGWKSHQEQAIFLWSNLAFHIARVTILVAKHGYMTQVPMLLRPLADAIHACLLFGEHPSWAKRVLDGAKLPTAAKIRHMLKQSPWPGYHELHSFVHARAPAAKSYVLEIEAGRMTVAIGPNPDPELFQDTATEVSVLALTVCNVLQARWQTIASDGEWTDRQLDLVHRTVKLVEERFPADRSQSQ